MTGARLVGVLVAAPFLISAALLGLGWAGRALTRRYHTWQWAALNCPHRARLRRYRWPLTLICAIRIGPAHLTHTIRNHLTRSHP